LPAANFLLGGVVFAFWYCIAISLVVFAAFLVLGLPAVLALKMIKHVEWTDLKKTIGKAALYVFASAVLILAAGIVYWRFHREASLTAILLNSAFSLVESGGAGLIVGGVVLFAGKWLIGFFEKILSGYVEVKQSKKEDFENSKIPIIVAVCVGLCFMGQQMLGR
jgi:hypothetical protein